MKNGLCVASGWTVIFTEYVPINSAFTFMNLYKPKR